MAMRCIVMIAIAARVAAAQPGAQDASEACKAERRARVADAMKVEDVSERGRLLASIPECRRRDDGSLELVVPPPPPHEDTTPFAPRAELAVRTGLAASALLPGAYASATATSPFVEVEVGWHARRHLAVALYAGTSRLHDPTYTTLIGQWVIDGSCRVVVPMFAMYDVDERLYDVGARLHFRHDRLSFGGGVGLEIDRGKAYADYPDHTNVLAEVGVDAALHLARIDRAIVELLGIATFAVAPSEPDRDVVSLRLGLGLRI
jgi:hypothetical protein